MKITEVAIVTTQSPFDVAGNLSLYCPHTAGSSLMTAWFERALTEILIRKSSRFNLFTDTAGIEHRIVNTDAISSLTVTRT